MGLLEIVKNENNDLDKINSLKKFCEVELGKGAIVCNDTPGFLGNRIGVFAMQVAMTEAFKMKLSIEEADAIFGRPMGIPKTGVFGLYDLIGIDLMADVLKSFIKELSENDPFQEVAKEIPLVKKLIETGYTGRKGKGLPDGICLSPQGLPRQGIDHRAGDCAGQRITPKSRSMMPGTQDIRCVALCETNADWKTVA